MQRLVRDSTTISALKTRAEVLALLQSADMISIAPRRFTSGYLLNAASRRKAISKHALSNLNEQQQHQRGVAHTHSPAARSCPVSRGTVKHQPPKNIFEASRIFKALAGNNSQIAKSSGAQKESGRGVRRTP